MAEPTTPITEKERLTAERETVLQEIRRLRESLSSELDINLEEGDTDIVLRETNLALMQTFEQSLTEIDEALKAIEAGTYGVCERCGQKIDPERLRVMPETRLCVSCKSILEKSRRLGV